MKLFHVTRDVITIVADSGHYHPEVPVVVRVDLNLSLDGVAVTADQTPAKPMGEDWGRLTEHYVGTRTFRERVLHETSGGGDDGDG